MNTLRRRRCGATLIELLVALVLLDLAILSLATMSAVAARRIGDAGRRRRAALAVANRIERVAARPCAAAGGGSRVIEPRVLESWDVRDRARSIELAVTVDVLVGKAERIEARTWLPC